jgi:lipopolysaccharide export system permease protein
MLILQRYLLREGLFSSVLSLVILVGVIQALFLAELFSDAAQGQLPAGSIIVMLALRVPEAILLVGPLALLTGLLLALGRLNEQSELVVMRSSGASFTSVLIPVGLLSVLWAVLLLCVSGWLSPIANERSSDLLAEAARHALVAGLQPGQFESLDQGRLTIYVGSVNRADGRLRDVFIRHDDAEFHEVLSAAEGRIWIDELDDTRYLSLIDGVQVRHGANPRETGVREIRFARNDIRLPSPALSGGAEGELVRTLSQLSPPQSPLERREWHWRVAPAVAALMLALLAMPLAQRLPRQGRFGPLVLALALYLVYSNAIHAGLVVMEQRQSTAGPGLWPVHAMLFLMILSLLIRQWRKW